MTEYKFKLLPNQDQQDYFEKCFYITKFVYDSTFKYKKDLYNKGINYSVNKARKDFTKIKRLKGYEFLLDINANSIYKTISISFNDFKNTLQENNTSNSNYVLNSFVTPFTKNNIKIDLINKEIKIPKISSIKYDDNIVFEGKIKDITIYKDKHNDYFAILKVKPVKKEENDSVLKECNAHLEYLKSLPDSILIERLQCSRCNNGEFNHKCRVCQKAFQIIQEKHKILLNHFARKLYFQFHRYNKWAVEDFEASLRLRIINSLLNEIDSTKLDENYDFVRKVHLYYYMERHHFTKKYSAKKRLKGEYIEMPYVDSCYEEPMSEKIKKLYLEYDFDKLREYLTDQERVVFDLTLKDYKSKEIAQALKVHPSRISQLKERITLKLRRKVQEMDTV